MYFSILNWTNSDKLRSVPLIHCHSPIVSNSDDNNSSFPFASSGGQLQEADRLLKHPETISLYMNVQAFGKVRS